MVETAVAYVVASAPSPPIIHWLRLVKQWSWAINDSAKSHPLPACSFMAAIIGDNTDQSIARHISNTTPKERRFHMLPPKVRQQSDTLHVSCQHTQLRGLP